MPDLKVLLISTYELGRQPFGLASPAAWLRADGFYTTSLVGIEPRRAHLVISDKVTFPRAPLQSRKVGFPDSGFRLGFPREAFPGMREA